MSNKETNKVIKICAKQKVKIRKYKIDIPSLQKCLKEHKTLSKFSNKQIADKLNCPLTLVEHWFRTDDCFSIPNENIWFKLKEILLIEDNSFDKSITEFEFTDGVYEKSERCYLDIGISPTLTTDSVETIITTK